MDIIFTRHTIMYEGDKLYNGIDTNHKFLLPSELPTHVSAYDCTFITNITSECFGSFTQGASVVCRLLHGALELTSNIYASKYGIFCLGDTTGTKACGIIYSDDHYYIFDPHSRDRNGMPCENDTTLVMHFSTQRDCVHYIIQLAVSLAGPLFILTYISICATHHVERSTFMGAPCHYENVLLSYEQTKGVTASERHTSGYEVSSIYA